MRIPIFDVDDNIDEKTCLGLYDNSYDFYGAVLKSFTTQGRKELKELREFMRTGDKENYRILVHGLKSAAGSVGALNLQNLASMMDKAYKRGEWDIVEANHLKLLDDYEKLIALIDNRLERS